MTNPTYDVSIKLPDGSSDIVVSNNRQMVIFAGPCQMESRSHALETAAALAEISSSLGIGLIYKSSFDKANRTSASSARGIGIDAALPIFAEIRQKFNIPVITDIHEREQCAIVAEVVDVLQIPAFLSRQTDLIIAAAETGRVINIKKGQFLAPQDIVNAIAKSTSGGNNRVIVTERGVCFGYNNLVVDMRSLTIMARTGYPVMLDATHAVQSPGGLGNRTGGDRRFVPTLARAGVAVGIAALFMETHEDPDNAPSDGPNMVPLQQMKDLINELMAIDKIAKSRVALPMEE